MEHFPFFRFLMLTNTNTQIRASPSFISATGLTGRRDCIKVINSQNRTINLLTSRFNHIARFTRTAPIVHIDSGTEGCSSICATHWQDWELWAFLATPYLGLGSMQKEWKHPNSVANVQHFTESVAHDWSRCAFPSDPFLSNTAAPRLPLHGGEKATVRTSCSQ